MAEAKRALDIELLQLDISGLIAPSESRHLVTTELIWPRLLVSGKTSLKTLRLHKGKVDLTAGSWCSRILFKETVEHTFGLSVKVSQSLTSALFDELVRFVGGAVFGAAASLADSHVGGELGDIASAPLAFARKKALASYDADIILEGTLDFDASSLKRVQEVEVPLLTLTDRYEPPRSGVTRAPARRKLIARSGTRLGTARILLKDLTDSKQGDIS